LVCAAVRDSLWSINRLRPWQRASLAKLESGRAPPKACLGPCVLVRDHEGRPGACTAAAGSSPQCRFASRPRYCRRSHLLLAALDAAWRTAAVELQCITLDGSGQPPSCIWCRPQYSSPDTQPMAGPSDADISTLLLTLRGGSSGSGSARASASSTGRAQDEAALALYRLSRRSQECNAAIAAAGAIPILVQLLCSSCRAGSEV